LTSIAAHVSNNAHDHSSGSRTTRSIGGGISSTTDCVTMEVRMKSDEKAAYIREILCLLN
jgi:hypothetical protein